MDTIGFHACIKCNQLVWQTRWLLILFMIWLGEILQTSPLPTYYLTLFRCRDPVWPTLNDLKNPPFRHYVSESVCELSAFPKLFASAPANTTDAFHQWLPEICAVNTIYKQHHISTFSMMTSFSLHLWVWRFRTTTNIFGFQRCQTACLAFCLHSHRQFTVRGKNLTFDIWVIVTHSTLSLFWLVWYCYRNSKLPAQMFHLSSPRKRRVVFYELLKCFHEHS